MAPHWKCGSGQPVAGSNPALSATHAAVVTRPLVLGIVPVELATFRFPDDEPWAGEEGVVIAHAIRHVEGVVLFDTGFGFGSADLDARYHPVPRPIDVALADVGIATDDVIAIVNCHLHADHAGQNGRFPGVATYVQPAELE